MKLFIHILSLLVLFSFKACNNNHLETQGNLKITAILYSYQSSDSEWTKEIIIRDSIISSTSALFDVYFVNNFFPLHNYLPSNGIFSDSIKDNECKMDYAEPSFHFGKCYNYDTKDRVVNMSVTDPNGRPSRGPWLQFNYIYKYDELDRIIEIKWKEVDDTYTYHYDNNSGYLTEMVIYSSGAIKNRLEIQYQ